jgi:hypothetical protein
MNKIIKSVKKVIQKSTAPKMWPATIVTSGSRTGYTKVKFSNGFEMDVLNYRIASKPDMKISVGYDPMMPGALQVLGIREDLRYLGENSAYTFFIVDHHQNHEYPNHDVIWVQGAQFIPNNVLPVPDTLNIRVYGSTMRTAGDWVAMRSTTMDMTARVPATGSRYVLVEMDTDGTAIATNGTIKTLPLLTIGDIPEPTSGRMPIAAVLLRAGQTTIVRDVRSGHRNDIIDLRWSGWSRGGRADDFDMAGAIHDATASAITDDDEMGFWESVAAGLRKITWANVVATLKTYFDTLYAVVATGMPAGGLAGQVLAKDTGTDYDVSWQDVASAATGDIVFHIDGALSVEDDVPNANIATKNISVEAVYLYCKTLGTAGSTIIDILCNGTSILNDGITDNRLVLAYDDANQWVSAIPLTFDFVEGDIFTVNIDQIATGAADAVVVLAIGTGGTMSHFNLTVEEADGSPSLPNIDTIEFAGATVENDAGKAKVTALGKLMQMVSTEYTTMSTGTTLIPGDDTIPQNTEGDEYFTCSITPMFSTSKLRIDVNVYGSHSASGGALTVALFKDTDVNAIGVGRVLASANYMRNVSFTRVIDASTTSTITFKIRAGSGTAGTTTINGNSGTRYFGGILVSSIVITEIRQ